jgi:hypothetical protein
VETVSICVRLASVPPRLPNVTAVDGTIDDQPGGHVVVQLPVLALRLGHELTLKGPRAALYASSPPKRGSQPTATRVVLSAADASGTGRPADGRATPLIWSWLFENAFGHVVATLPAQ